MAVLFYILFDVCFHLYWKNATFSYFLCCSKNVWKYYVFKESLDGIQCYLIMIISEQGKNTITIKIQSTVIADIIIHIKNKQTYNSNSLKP